MIRLIGILLVCAGFAFRLNTLAVAVAAGLTTGLLAGVGPVEMLEMLGRFFVDNRYMTVPVVLMVPIVGVLERHGLQERVAQLIRKASAATAGRVLWLYQCLREATSVLGLSIGNHASMIRPLIAPMAESAAGVAPGVGPEDPKAAAIRAQAAAAENVGNFFADDIVVAVGALLLLHGTLTAAGVEVTLRELKLWSIPTALWAVAVGWWRFRRLDRKLGDRSGSRTRSAASLDATSASRADDSDGGRAAECAGGDSGRSTDDNFRGKNGGKSGLRKGGTR